MAIKLDFNQAYDRVEWDFLEATMAKLGFYSKWIRWVMNVSQQSSLSGSEWGIKGQGDP